MTPTAGAPRHGRRFAGRVHERTAAGTPPDHGWPLRGRQPVHSRSDRRCWTVL